MICALKGKSNVNSSGERLPDGLIKLLESVQYFCLPLNRAVYKLGVIPITDLKLLFFNNSSRPMSFEFFPDIFNKCQKFQFGIFFCFMDNYLN